MFEILRVRVVMSARLASLDAILDILWPWPHIPKDKLFASLRTGEVRSILSTIRYPSRTKPQSRSSGRRNHLHRLITGVTFPPSTIYYHTKFWLLTVDE